MTETKPPTPAGPAPTLLRRHAAGAESARGLLFTVLGELVLPTGGEAWTSAFIDVFGRLGVEEKAARQALMRTAADNWLSSERVGRRTLWRLPPRPNGCSRTAPSASSVSPRSRRPGAASGRS